MKEGQKAENVGKMREARERGKIECGQTYKTGRRQSRRREGNRKESETNGEGCEEGERGARKRASELGKKRESGAPG